MQLELLNEQGQATAKVDAPDTVFARDYNEALVHQVVVAFQANARQGTRAQLDRGEVKHSTKKPFRQKGTGRARAGMTSSPLWRGGGRIFPNSPDENFSQKVNKKMYRAGMAAIFSQLAREGRVAMNEDGNLGKFVGLYFFDGGIDTYFSGDVIDFDNKMIKEIISDNAMNLLSKMALQVEIIFVKHDQRLTSACYSR